MTVAVGALCAIVAASVQPTPTSSVKALLSPYRRPTLLQPRRLLAETYALYGETVMRSVGQPVGKVGVDIEIREAGRRGKGLFALRDFAPNELVARYSGVVATENEYLEAFDAGLTSGNYIASCADDGSLVIDSDRTDTALGQGAGRYVNHSRLWQNCAIVSFTVGGRGNSDSVRDQMNPGETPTGAAYIKTTRAVKAGSEFLTDYGPAYWDNERQAGFSRNNVLKRFVVDYWP